MKTRLAATREYWPLLTALVGLAVGLGFWLAGVGAVSDWVWGLTAGLGMLPFVYGMIRDVMRGEFGVDILAVTAITASLLLHQYLAAAVIMVMLSGGDALEKFAQGRAKRELSSLLERSPKMAHRLTDHSHKSTEEVPVGQVKVGDRLLIRPGEVVPVDAVIAEGASSFDEAAITGEPIPVDRAVGQDIVSGSVNANQSVVAEATRTAGDSQYQQIVNMVAAAASSRSPLVRLADRYSVPFTLVSFGIAGAGWALSGSPIRALSVLVVATPCPLLIATPVAIVAGMSRAARHGIIVKGGAALERLARLRSLAFDKTGTLTVGTPGIYGIYTKTDVTKEELLALAATVASVSNHILARAIVAEAGRRGIKLLPIKNMAEEPGDGMWGTIHGQKVVVGKPGWIESQVVKGDGAGKLEDREVAQITVDGKYVGHIVFADKLRPETKDTLKQLENLGVKKTLMLTGGREATARYIAGLLGMTDYRGGLLPAQKVEAVRGLEPRWHPVGMVGDGVNDAPTLAAADVGIALGARGSTAASESADVVIMQDNLVRVATAIRIARRAMRIAQESIWVGISLSVVLMVIAASGRITPVYGAFMQEGVDVLVILNALRARHGSRVLPRPHKL